MKWWVIGKIIEQGTIKGFIIQNENNYRLCILKSHIKDYNIVSHRVTSDNKLIGKQVAEYDSNKIIGLYHGSKSGLKGKIKPISRSNCDFGKGFYLGTNKAQVSDLASRGSRPTVYSISLYLGGLEVYNLSKDLELWSLYIGYCRDKIFNTRDTPINLLKEFKKVSSSDVICGPIADDGLTQVYDAFSSNALSIEGLVACLKYVNYGNQYILKTTKACNSIISVHHLGLGQNASFSAIPTSLVTDMTRKYGRRQYHFVEDILDKWR